MKQRDNKLQVVVGHLEEASISLKRGGQSSSATSPSVISVIMQGYIYLRLSHVNIYAYQNVIFILTTAWCINWLHSPFPSGCWLNIYTLREKEREKNCKLKWGKMKVHSFKGHVYAWKCQKTSTHFHENAAALDNHTKQTIKRQKISRKSNTHMQKKVCEKQLCISECHIWTSCPKSRSVVSAVTCLTRQSKYSPVACKENIKHSLDLCVFRCVYLCGCVFTRNCQYTTGPHLHLGSYAE